MKRRERTVAQKLEILQESEQTGITAIIGLILSEVCIRNAGRSSADLWPVYELLESGTSTWRHQQDEPESFSLSF